METKKTAISLMKGEETNYDHFLQAVIFDTRTHQLSIINNQSSMASLMRIRKEVTAMKKDKDYSSYCLITTENNPFHCIATINGPPDTPYQGGVFRLNFDYSVHYPITPPKCSFITKIYHPNIDSQGQISVNILKEEWSPTLTIMTTLLSITSLLGDHSLTSLSFPRLPSCTRKIGQSSRRLLGSERRSMQCDIHSFILKGLIVQLVPMLCYLPLYLQSTMLQNVVLSDREYNQRTGKMHNRIGCCSMKYKMILKQQNQERCLLNSNKIKNPKCDHTQERRKDLIEQQTNINFLGKQFQSKRYL